MTPVKDNYLDVAFEKGLQLAFPPVLVQLIQALLDPSPSFTTIAGYLKMDPMLAGRVLHIVNTGSYGLSEKVRDLQRAAIVMGTSELFRLVLALALQKRLNPTKPRAAEYSFGDWRLTIWSAMAAEAIAGQICPESRKEAYLAGMLKDLPLYLALCNPEVPPFLNKPRCVTLPAPDQFAEETSLWGRSHPEISRDITLYWGLPENLAEIMRVHHDYENINSYPPLAQSVIFATRWAELLHAPDAEPAKLIMFELELAELIGRTGISMELFRASCAERFNILMGQLGIHPAKPETRLHDRSLADIQSCYFLTLGVFDCLREQWSSPFFARTLQRQLRLFWDITEWDMLITLNPGAEGDFFRCRQSASLQCDRAAFDKMPRKSGWLHIPFTWENKTYGFLAVPTPSQSSKAHQALPLFARMIAMQFEEHLSRITQKCETAPFADLPFVFARLGKDDQILHASASFLETFKLKEVPEGLPVQDLLAKTLDISLDDLEQGDEEGREAGRRKSGKSRKGYFFSVPEGHFPGTPLYIAQAPVPEKPEESFLLLGDVTSMHPLQALSLAHAGLLEALFESLDEQLCLLSEEGRVLWADDSCKELLGKNIFNLSRPVIPPQQGRRSNPAAGRWNTAFLANLSSSTRVQVMLALAGSLVPYQFTFTPLPGKKSRQYLLLLHGSPVQAEQAEGQAAPPAPAEEKAEREERLSLLKLRDSLTDLYGYTQFHMLLGHVSEQGKRQNFDTGLVFCDIEGLHKFNALHGCQQGDSMLRRVAGSLAESCRPGQDYAFRYGADKFAIIVSKANKELMDELAANILQQVQERCGSKIMLNIGLVLVSPSEDPKARLDAARRASEQAAGKEPRIVWAD